MPVCKQVKREAPGNGQRSSMELLWRMLLTLSLISIQVSADNSTDVPEERGNKRNEHEDTPGLETWKIALIATLLGVLYAAPLIPCLVLYFKNTELLIRKHTYGSFRFLSTGMFILPLVALIYIVKFLKKWKPKEAKKVPQRDPDPIPEMDPIPDPDEPKEV